MKALSVKQPWADWLIGKNLPCQVSIKDIENRTWNTNFRGIFRVHASKKIDKEAFNWFRNKFGVEPITEGYETGAIIGHANLVACEEGSTFIGWGMTGCYHWFIEDQVAYDNPVKCNGALGFWDCSDIDLRGRYSHERD